MSRTSKNLLAWGMLVLVVYWLATWPYLLGTWLAVQLGAGTGSPARTVLGWTLEIAYLTAIPLLVALHRGLDLSRRPVLNVLATGLGVLGSATVLTVAAVILTG